jgi:hypothetical protein
MQDNKAYLMCKMSPWEWKFVPLNAPFMFRYFPFETWEDSSIREKYFFNRVCYSYTEACHINNMSNLGIISPRECPDIYNVTDSKGKIVAVVWKSPLPHKIEITFYFNKTISYKMKHTLSQREIGNILRGTICSKKNTKIDRLLPDSYDHVLFRTRK